MFGQDVAASPTSQLSGAFAAMRDGRGKRIVGGVLAAGGVWQLGQQLVDRIKVEVTYTVAVEDGDAIYHDVHRWVLDAVPARKQRGLTVMTKRADRDGWAVPVSDGNERPVATPLRLFYDGKRSQTVNIDGHRVKILVEKPDHSRPAEGGSDWMSMLDPARLLFTCTGADARDAVLRLLDRIAQEKHAANPQPNLFMARWSEWRSRKDLPVRSLDSVVLRPGIKEELVDDLTDFLGREDDYVRLGVPWHRGYLFSGPPGGGKTSAAKALANHFGLDVYSLALSDLESDTVMLQLVSAVQPRSMLLIEDVDIVHGAKVRDDSEGNGVSLGAMLNSLDGISTPHGLITVLTTNDKSKLDGALLRAGRVDREIHFANVNVDQIEDLIFHFTGIDWTAPTREVPDMSAADVVEIVKRHLGKPEAAIAELNERLGQ